MSNTKYNSISEDQKKRLSDAADEYAKPFDKPYCEDAAEHHYCGGADEYLANGGMPKKWEYDIVVRDNDPLGEDGLNEIGQEGWELCSVIIGKPGVMYYFKRPIIEDNARN